MKRIGIGLFVGLLLTSGAAASDLDALSSQLGDVIGAEAGCGLTYNGAAIEAFITSKVPADNLEFAGDLDSSARYRRSQFDDMTDSERTAFCTQTERVARNYGFLK